MVPTYPYSVPLHIRQLSPSFNCYNPSFNCYNVCYLPNLRDDSNEGYTETDHRLPFIYLNSFSFPFQVIVLILLLTITPHMEIRLSRPCVEDRSRYIAECHLGKRLVMEKLCDVLRRTGVKELKCSIRLGVARFELEGRSVMLYQSGRVDIRRIQNTGEARDVLEQIISLVKDAFSDISS